MLAAAGLAFGPYLLDSRTRSLSRGSESVGLSKSEYEVLHLLARRPQVILSKDHLIRAGWSDTAVGDNALEKVVANVRRLLDASDRERYIKTVYGRGYQFVADVMEVDTGEDDSALDRLLAPHRATTEGRAALESLRYGGIATARDTFAQLCRGNPGDPAPHIGLANACVMQFEATRTDAAPDADALRLAAAHAQQACRLDPDRAEAWATLGFVLERTGRREQAVAALERAVTLEPDNWRHQVRLALGSWGEVRLRAARRALALCPHLPLAHWLAASVFVARNALDKAEHEADEGLGAAAVETDADAPFSMVALHTLKGLLCLARGSAGEAQGWFDRELALEARGHLYAREAAANAWYAKGACCLGEGDRDAARAAFGEAVARVGRHPMAHAGLAIVDDLRLPAEEHASGPEPVDLAVARAARQAWDGDLASAAEVVTTAIGAAPPGNGGWLLPVEPLLRVGQAPEAWASALNVLHLRAR